jgi:hypothetical protein
VIVDQLYELPSSAKRQKIRQPAEQLRPADRPMLDGFAQTGGYFPGV